MMMHSEEEKLVLPSVKKISKFFFAIIILGSIVYPQTNLNGFCEISILPSVPNGDKVFSSLIDRDTQPDYLVTTRERKIILYLSSDEYKMKSIITPFEISLVKKVKNISRTENEFAFISRKERVFGTFSLNEKGRAYNFKTISFNSSPDNFVLSKNGKKAIVFGNNFNGLAFVDLDFSQKESLTFLDKKIVADAVFYDFDNDLNTDILYYDIFSQSINIIKNEVNFQLVEIDLYRRTDNLSRIRKADFNFDGFEDIVFSSARGIEIFIGDSVNTFEESNLLVEAENIVDFQMGDFNRDGYFDLVYLAKEKGVGNKLYISFSSRDNVLRKFQVSTSTPVLSFDVAGPKKDMLVYLTKDGLLTRLSSIGELDGSAFRLGLEPINIFSIKNNNKLLYSTAVIDSFDNKFKLLTNAFGNYYEIGLKKLHKNLVVETTGSSDILIVLFTINKKLIEINKLNLENGKTWAGQYYTTDAIRDIKIDLRNKELPNIIALTEKNGTAGFEEFEYRDFRYQKSEPKTLVDSVLSVKLVDTSSMIYLRKNIRNEIEYGKKYFKDFDQSKRDLKLILKDNYEISFSDIIPFRMKGQDYEFVSIGNNDKQVSYLIDEERIIQLDEFIPLTNLKVLSRSINSFLEFVFERGGEIVYAELNMKTGEIRDSKKITDYSGNFVVEYVNRKNGYIFMINNNNHLIDLKKIE